MAVDVTGFNRRRREIAAKQAAEQLAKVEEHSKEKMLDEMPYQELRALAKERKIEGYYKMNTEELKEALKEVE